MSIKDTEILIELKKDLAKGMLDFMAEADVAYDKTHVEECLTILDGHLEALEKADTSREALTCVKETVEKLNQLNNKADQELIETEQREQICRFIIKAGALLGHNEDDEDVTGKWREW